MKRGVNERVYEKLRQVARARKLVTYAEVALLADSGIANPRDPRLGRILHGICGYEVQQGRPMLGAVVVRKADNRPGEGFFREASGLGLFRGSDKLAFWASELDKVYTCWSSR